MNQTWNVNRITDSCCTINNQLDLDVRLFANKDVAIENDAFEELFNFLDVERAIRDIKEAENKGQLSFFDDSTVGVGRVVLTPDFHKGSGSISVGAVVETNGFVVPQAIGNDICCGMRLLATDLPIEKWIFGG